VSDTPLSKRTAIYPSHFRLTIRFRLHPVKLCPSCDEIIVTGDQKIRKINFEDEYDEFRLV
jgi:hypothetical protein